MKLTLVAICFLLSINSHAQEQKKTKNIFIITTDGFRWEEVFKGADSSLICNNRFVQDIALTKQMFWDSSDDLRRKKLMPFFWNVLSKKGQIYGNRLLENKVNVKNFYKISYPGYNEIFTGRTDINPVLNSPVLNKNTSILEYLNSRADFTGKVVAFSSWDIMPFILNEPRSGFSVNSGYEMLDYQSEEGSMIDSVQKNIKSKGRTRHDQLTYLSAKEYISQYHPKALFLGLGETDECAHSGQYDLYLQRAAAVDKMIADLWYFIQTDPFYKDNTTLIITTDHGRGKKGAAWRTHGFWVKGSGEVWLAMIGPDILPLGEMTNNQQIWQKQIASTAALLVGEHFAPGYRVAAPFNVPGPAKLQTNYLTKSK
ncbi:MAG: hypothetical protein ABIQ31_14380 [Ferruginibacter sp.]